MSKSVKASNKKAKKQGERDVLKTLVPYFRLKMGELGGRATCQLAGYAQPNDKIQDDIIDSVDDGKKSTHGVYEISYMTQHCNISGSYLVKNDKLPIYCKSVLYSRQFLSGNLFSCYLYFTLDEQTKETVQNKTKKVMSNGVEVEVKDYSKYYNRLMSGKFTMELMTIDDDFLKNFLEHKRDELESEFMMEYIDEFEGANDEEKENILSKINDKIDVMLSVYKKYFEPVEIENPRKKKIIQAMDDLFANPHMSELISFGLKFRDKKRIEESCPDQTFERPKKVINLRELKEHEDNLDEKLDEMLENCSDSDYSDKSD
jgi:hypothetical protein